MQRPEMIIFDYGQTLVYDKCWNPEKGTAEVLKYVIKNPNQYTLKDIRRAADDFYGKSIERIRKCGYDVGATLADKVLYEKLGIEFSLSPEEQELVFWRAASDIVPMPHVEKVLEYLNQANIRYGVISNLIWSGTALTKRLKELFPYSNFEFVITSSDYIFRKPNTMMFEIALQKAGLLPANIWYCGNNLDYDILPASKVGMFPVWYTGNTFGKEMGLKPTDAPCKHLHIYDWSRFLEILRECDC